VTTKAEWFRYQAERTHPPAAPAGPPPLPHREPRAARKALYALEDSAGRPSRKATRKSSNRSRNDAQMRMKRATAEARPESRPRPVRPR
jgi:hypothetical protein